MSRRILAALLWLLLTAWCAVCIALGPMGWYLLWLFAPGECYRCLGDMWRGPSRA